MKKLLFILFLTTLAMPVSFSVYGKSSGDTLNSPTNNLAQKVSDLSERFTSFESTWGHFQLGGDFSIGADTVINSTSASDSLKLNQRLSLFLNAFIDPHTQLSFKILHPGIWGSVTSPLIASPQVDEAYLRFEYPNTLNYIGRFRFSLGPIGLISDFMANDPVEGIAVQQAFNRFLLAGLYSPVYSELGEDYFAARIGWSNQSSTVGVNFVPNGINGEKDISVDYTAGFSHSNLLSEIALYSFDSKKDQSLNVSWAPAILINYTQQFHTGAGAIQNYFQIKTGYISPEFKPSYSSLAHSSGGTREWFLPNSKGLELFLQTGLMNSLRLNNRLGLLMPVTNYNQPDVSYHLLTSFTKLLSPVNQINFGVELKTVTEKTFSTELFATWNLQF